MKINVAAFLFLSSEFKYQVTRKQFLKQPFALELLQKWLLNGNYLLLACVGEKNQQPPPFLFFSFFFSLLNKAKIYQPNKNWQHSFKNQNKARPSWALTRLLYLFVPHVLGPCAIQLPLMWAGLLCSAFPSPPGTLKLFLWLPLCVTSVPRWNTADPSPQEQPRLQRWLQPQTQTKLKPILVPDLQSCKQRLEIDTRPSRNASWRTHRLCWGFPNQSFFGWHKKLKNL